MPVQIPNPVDPMAAQMAQLLASSDLDELREIIKRWVAEAVNGNQRRIYENFGARRIELKQALAEAPVQPTKLATCGAPPDPGSPDVRPAWHA